ncbi:MAG: TonB-dependent siderophore receptor [Acidobacteria bacterium]|nr:TonB-dependent siderophore receptor [Acidobacteriota bacterium]
MKNRIFARGDAGRRTRKHGTSRLFVLGALAASATVCGPLTTAAYAAEAQASPVTAAQPAAQTIRFDIQAGALETVLPEFEKVTGITVVVTDPGIRMIQSPGVSGLLAPQQAIDRLLEGTSVRAMFSSSTVARLELRGVAEFVEVTGANPTVASPKFTQPLRDIPQTINLIPQAVIQEQGATTLRDVLRNVVGITFQAGEGGVPAGDQLTIRGFSARTDMFIDGVRDFGGYSRDSFNLEQVEVAKGPSSAIAGRGSTGGAINQVSKTPHVGNSYDVSLGGGNADYKRGTIDVNQPLTDSVALRMNVLWTDSGVPGRDFVKNERWGVAPSITFGLDSPTRLTVSHLHLSQDNLPEYGLPWVPANTNPELAEYANGQPPVNFSNFYGLTGRDYEDTKTDVTTAQVDRALSSGTTLRNLTRYGRNDRDSVITTPRFTSVNTSTALNRQLQSRDMLDTIVTNQTSMISRFGTGTVAHAITAGFEVAREASENFARSGPTAPPADLFNPDPTQPYPGPITRTGASTNGTADSLGLYAFDTVQVTEKLELTGGLRWDRFAVDSDATAIAGDVTSFERTDKMASWRGGAVFKPRSNGSVYLGYATAFNPSAEGLSLSAATVMLEPEKTRSLELGTKWDIMGGRLSLSTAGFRTEKTNARTPGVNPGDAPTVLAGEQTVKGVELGASGRITNRLSVLSGYAYMQSEIEASNTPTELGNALALTPAHTLSLWTTFDATNEISFGGGAQYMDAVFRNATNTAQVPSYWLLNALASYRVNENLTLRFNGQNLADKQYADRVGGGHFIPGPGRQLMLTTDFQF